MLNPKIVERFGEDCVRIFNLIYDAIGEELAQTCYASLKSFTTVGGASMPSYMSTTDDTKRINNALYEIIMRENPDDEDFNNWISLFVEQPEEGYVKVWLK